MPGSTPRLGAPLVARVLVLAGCGDDDGDGAAAPADTTETTTPTTATTTDTTATTMTTTTASDEQLITIDVVGGEPVGGAREERAALGEEVTLRVTADAPDEVHVHGYDLFADVGPGQPAEITFVADIPGQFEIELEQSHVLLVDLLVS